MKKLCTILLIAVILTACGSGDNGRTFNDYKDFEGEIIGVPQGNLAVDVIRDSIKGAPGLYPDVNAALADIRSGKIAGFITDLSVVNAVAAAHEDFKVIPVPADIFSGPLGAFASEQDLIDEFNAFLAELKADGTLADMQKRWLEGALDETDKTLDLDLSGDKGHLRVAATNNSKPFSYGTGNPEILNRPLAGYSIELVIRFASSMDMGITFHLCEFSELIDAVADGDVDFGIDAVTITSERAEKVIFSDSIYDETLGILTLK
jgi:polar amino acid transport system substrate-binding protein